MKTLTDLTNGNLEGNILTFDSELVMEGSFGSYDLDGMFKNQMEFVPESSMIIWNYGQDAADEDEEVIGLDIEGKVITGYDGLMSFPTPARILMESLGYDCTEVADDYFCDTCYSKKEFRMFDVDGTNLVERLVCINENCARNGLGE